MEDEVKDSVEVIEHSHQEYVDARRAPRVVEELKPEPVPIPEPVVVAPVAPAPEPVVDPVKDLTESAVDYKSEYEKLKAETEKNKDKNNPYKNANYFKLEVIEQESPEEAKLFQKLLFGDVDSKELWKIDFLQKHPDATSEQAQRKLERTFPALFDSTLTPEDQERKDAEMDLEVESKAVKRTLMKRLDGISIPEPPKADNAELLARQELAKSWKPRFEQLTKDTKFTVEIPIGEDKTQKETFEFDIPEADKAKYLEGGAYFLLSQNLTADQAGYAKVKDFITKQYIADNHLSLATTIAEKVAKSRDDVWAKKVHNAEPIKATPASTQTGVLSEEEHVQDAIARADAALKRNK
jgi:hypothetical protein